jgi:tricorn protease-like protein
LKDYGFINTISSVATDEFTEINKCQQADVRRFAFSKDSNYICEVKPDIIVNSNRKVYHHNIFKDTKLANQFICLYLHS